MILQIYKTLRSFGFSSKGQDIINNKRLGIKKSFSKGEKYYIEIWPENWGFSIFVFGAGFMSSNGVYPYCFSIMDKEDIDNMRIEINKRLSLNGT